MVRVLHEETPQAILADVGLDSRGILALSRNGKRPGVDIRAKHLDRGPDVLPRGLLQQQHRDSIGLLAGGAAGDPDTNRRIGQLAMEQLWDDLKLECLERFLVAEK